MEASEAPVAPEPKARFSPGIVNVVLLLLMAVSAVLATFSRRSAAVTAQGDALDIAYICGAVAGAAILILVVLGIGWVAWRVTRRTQLVGRVVVAVLAILMLFGQVMSTAVQNRRRAALVEPLRRLDDSRRTLIEDVSKQLDEKGYVEPDLAQVDRLNQQLGDVAGNLEGEAKIGAQVLLEFNREILDAATRYEQAVSVYLEAGGIGEASIKSLADIDAAVERIDAVIARSRDISALVREAPGSLFSRMIERGMVEDQARRMLGGALSTMHVDLALAVRQADEATFENQREMCAVLKAEWGRWEFDEASDMILFERDAAVETYSRLFEKQQQLQQEAQAAIRALIEAQRRK